MKVEGNMEIVFWALVGLLVGTAFGMARHLSELTLASTSGLSGAVIFGRHTCRPDHHIREGSKETTTAGSEVLA